MKIIQFRTFIFVLPLIVFAALFFPWLFHKTFVIYPGYSVNTTPFRDIYDGGNSIIIDEIKTSEEIGLQYVLKKDLQYPYVGLAFELDSGVRYTFSPFDYLEIRMRSSISRSNPYKVNVLTKLNPESYKRYILTDAHKYNYYTTVIHAQNDYRNIRIPLSDLTVPDWWLISGNVEKDSVDKITENEIKKIEIMTGHLDNIDIPIEFRIEYIAVKKKIEVIFAVSFFIALIIFAILFIGYEIVSSHRTKKKAQMTIRIRQNLDLGDEKEYEESKLFSFLEKRYNDPYISVQYVSDELNISVYKIPKIIQNHTGLSFKQYLNLLRIDEAKSQLLSSRNKIIDIAYAVGYNSIAHFNKQFKIHVGMSPKEYRTLHQ